MNNATLSEGIFVYLVFGSIIFGMVAFTYIYMNEVEGDWRTAPKWYQKLRESLVGQLIILVVFLLFIGMIIGANVAPHSLDRWVSATRDH